MSGLGRVVPPDWKHVEQFPLSALPPGQRPTQAPVVIGINWMTNFDAPVKDSAGFYHIGAGSLGTVRGGHCVVLEPAPGAEHDIPAAYAYYDQGQEGACFPAGTLVEMADGELRPIDQIRTLERVRTAEGNEGVVLQTSARLHTEGLVPLAKSVRAVA